MSSKFPAGHKVLHKPSSTGPEVTDFRATRVWRSSCTCFSLRVVRQ